MANKKRKTWKGNLARPIKTDQRPAPPSIIDYELHPEKVAEYKQTVNKFASKAAAQIVTESLEKMIELLDHYKIDKNDLSNRWYLLALNLAKEFDLGFRVETKKESGRPTECDIVSLALLYLNIEEKKRELKERGLSTKLTDVCRSLLKDEPYTNRPSLQKGKTLENLYRKAKKSPLVLLHLDNLNTIYRAKEKEVVHKYIDDFKKLLMKLPKSALKP